jgi:hypothetical protein
MSLRMIGIVLASANPVRRAQMAESRMRALARVGQHAEFLGAQVQSAWTENC